MTNRRLASPLMVTLVAAAFVLASQFKFLISLTWLRPNVLDDELDTTVPVESKKPVDQHGQIKKASGNFFGHSQNISCDTSPCNGFFAYDGPNKDKKAALEVFEKAVAEYRYGGERNNETHNQMIFMPNATNHPSCVMEWKEKRPKWVNRYVLTSAPVYSYSINFEPGAWSWGVIVQLSIVSSLY